MPVGQISYCRTSNTSFRGLTLWWFRWVFYRHRISLTSTPNALLTMFLPSGNCTSSLNSPPSQIVLSLPGIAQSHRLRSRVPCGVFIGRATKPKGWSLRHCLLLPHQSSVAHEIPVYSLRTALPAIELALTTCSQRQPCVCSVGLWKNVWRMSQLEGDT